MARQTPIRIEVDLDAKIDELKAATRTANEVLSDIRRERRAVEAARADLDALVRKRVEGVVEAEVKQQLARLARATDIAMRSAVARVEKTFDRLARIYLEGDPDGGEPLAELAERYKRRRDAGL